MKKLYLLTTEGLGEFYVVADNTLEAESALLTELQSQSYGTSDSRQVMNIRFITQEMGGNCNHKRKLLVVNNEKS